MNENWFSLSISQIEKKLKTNAASGLSRKAARSAWYQGARNSQSLFIRKNKKAKKMLGEVLSDFALVILLLAALFAVLFEEQIMGFTVIALCLLNVSVAFFSYYRSQRTMEKINLYFVPTAKVIRGGKLYRTSFENVVSGDVIIVQKGDIICADARLVVSDELSVVMRLNKKKAVKLKKQAHGVVFQNETNPTKLTNVLHAGSVVTEGSGRAIVFATGKYTYLGAMTGGITEIYNDNTPQELKKMKRICSQISFISMLCVLPFSVVSLLLSHLNGGNSTLSAAFLTALALSASSMTQLSCTMCKLFSVKKINDIAKSSDPAIIRTTDAFDRFSDIDYLFLLDGSALTDGVLHFESAFTIEGDVKAYDNYNSTVASLFEMAVLYNVAENNSLAVGTNLPDRYKKGLGEFISLGNTDVEALRIRYNIKSYLQGTPNDPHDKVNFVSSGVNVTLCVSTTDDIFSKCSHALLGGKAQPITSVGMDKLRHVYNMHTEQGKTVLVFTTTFDEGNTTNANRVFVGAVILREGVDKTAASSIKHLQKRGVKVISFVGGNKPIGTPEIPTEIHYGAKAYKHDFIRNQLAVTYGFGNIDTYYGLDEADIDILISTAQKEGRSVGVIGFSDFAQGVIEKADVFISCSEIVNVFDARTEEELYTLELAGSGSSTSCIQTVKEASDVLIQRPDGKRGGIRSLGAAFSAVEVASRNLYTFFRYSICSQLVRIITVALPMAYGKSILDARHVLLCSFVIDICVMLTLALDKRAIGGSRDDKQKYRIKPLKQHIATDKSILITTAISSVIAITLPIVIDMIGVFGSYLYQTEYLFCAVLWLHLALAYYVRYGSIKKVGSLLTNKWLAGIITGSVLFLMLISAFDFLGLIFDYISNPIAYFILSFVPSVIFGIAYELLPRAIRHKHAK